MHALQNCFKKSEGTETKQFCNVHDVRILRVQKKFFFVHCITANARNFFEGNAPEQSGFLRAAQYAVRQKWYAKWYVGQNDMGPNFESHLPCTITMYCTSKKECFWYTFLKNSLMMYRPVLVQYSTSIKGLLQGLYKIKNCHTKKHMYLVHS